MIKRTKIICLALMLLMLLATCVYAAEPQITIEGETTSKPGETKTVTVKIFSKDIELGVVSGQIEKNANVESMVVTGINNWNLTYNPETGVFNIYKAEGSKLEEILTIKYVLTDEEGIAKITISDINLTTIDYETIEAGSVSKEITVVAEPDGNEPDGNEPGGNEPDGNEPDGNEPEGNEPDENEPDGNEPDGNEPDGNEPDGNEPDGNEPDENEPDGNEPDENEPEGNKPDDKEQEDTKKPDDTQAKEPIVNTGLENCVFAMIVVIAVVGVVSYKKYIEYKNI